MMLRGKSAAISHLITLGGARPAAQLARRGRGFPRRGFEVGHTGRLRQRRPGTSSEDRPPRERLRVLSVPVGDAEGSAAVL